VTDETGQRREPTVSAGNVAAASGVLVLVTMAIALACSLVGVIRLSDLTLFIWRIRLMRLGVAVVVGAGLASGGMALQGMLRNPLAEPYILGISSGAGVGVLSGRC